MTLTRALPLSLILLAMMLFPTLLLYVFTFRLKGILTEAFALAKEHEQFMKQWREGRKHGMR